MSPTREALVTHVQPIGDYGPAVAL